MLRRTIAILALLLATGTAHAESVTLPKKFYGTWCPVEKTSDKMWAYQHNCEGVERPEWIADKSLNITISKHGLTRDDGYCRAVKLFAWNEHWGDAPPKVSYYVTFHCKDGKFNGLLEGDAEGGMEITYRPAVE